MTARRIVEIGAVAVIIGVVLNVVMGAANAYLALYVGMTVAAGIPSTVLVILLTKVFRRMNGQQVTVSETIASTAEAVAAAMAFTIPALLFANVWVRFEPFVVIVVGLAGGFLGVTISTFFRRPLVACNRELSYPEGKVAAALIRAWEKAKGGQMVSAVCLVVSTVIGVVVTTAATIFNLIKVSLAFAGQVGGHPLALGLSVGTALFGIGFIVEFSTTLNLFVGAAGTWLIAVPIYHTYNPTFSDDPGAIWSEVRFLGAGMMLVGGLYTMWRMKKILIESFLGAARSFTGRQTTTDDTANFSPEQREAMLANPEADRDINSRFNFGLLVISLVAVLVLFLLLLPLGVGLAAALATIITVVAFVAISIYLVGQIGSTNQPVSGICIMSLLFVCLSVYFLGGGSEAIIAVIIAIAITAVAAAVSGTVALNHKTAQLTATSPRWITWGSLLGVLVASLPLPFIFNFINNTMRIDELAAPQGRLFSTIVSGLFPIEGVEGRQIPSEIIGIGAAIAVGIIGLNFVLKKLRVNLSFSIMAVGVGVYLPAELSTTIFLGGLTWLILRKLSDRRAWPGAQEAAVLALTKANAEAVAKGEPSEKVRKISSRAVEEAQTSFLDGAWKPFEHIGLMLGSGLVLGEILTGFARGGLIQYLLHGQPYNEETNNPLPFRIVSDTSVLPTVLAVLTLVILFFVFIKVVWKYGQKKTED